MTKKTKNNIKILIGAANKTLKDIEDNSVDCCVTSPPYFALRDYMDAGWEGGDEGCDHVKDPTKTKKFGNEEFNEGHPSREETKTKGYYFDDICEKCGATRNNEQIGTEETPEQYIENLVSVFREIKRILKPEGVCFINIGDTYCGTGSKKDTKDPKYPEGRNGQAVAKNNKIQGIKSKDLIGIPWMLAFALRDDGWYLRQEIIWAKACSGIYSGGTVMPESTKSRFCRSHEQVFMLTKSKQYYFDYEAVAEEQKEISLKRAYANNNMDARKGKGDEQYAISGKNQDKTYAKMRERIEAGEKMTRNRRSVWTINIRPSKVKHFAPYPFELVKPCILAGCPEGGIVVDPFGGTGTTAIAANILGRNAIHCDLDPRSEHFLEERRNEIIKQRLTDGDDIVGGKIAKVRKLF